ncbi:MAG TPA: glycoside hydrolase family 38 C-terminal domain-containing protein, partial [Gemmatimonadales bacterium]|nr:glycoside hydrolase family 38 C-terminal domain-containing protein [Gemmatimonadales bacterium]
PPLLTPRSPLPIRYWLITEPVPTDTGAARVAKDYLGNETTAFPDSDSTWRPVVAPDSAEGLIDLNQLVRRGTDRTASYAFTYLYSPHEDTRTLILASDDDVAAWLNGQRIHYDVVARGTGTQRDTIVVRLAQGWNGLLLKIVNRTGGFGFGAWVDGGEPLRATNHRAADARQGNLPTATVTAGPLKLEAPLSWGGETLAAKGSIALTAWGPAPLSTASARLVSQFDTLQRTVADSLTPGIPREVRLQVDVLRLAAAAARDTPPVLVITWGAGRNARSAVAPVLVADRVLGLSDGRIQLAWTPSEAGTALETRVRVPPLFAGLTLDLLAAEFGPTARFLVNGAARPWQNGIVALCAPCGAGDSLAIRVERDPSRPWWDPPRMRIHDRTYSDIARNLALLPALGDSSGTVIAPDARAWLAAMLQADKTDYRALAAQSNAQLTAHHARVTRDTIELVGNSHIDAAWLWRVAETQEVVENTWRTALKLQQKFPGATFAASAAQYYAWLETRAPGLLDSIRAAEQHGGGTWSIVGGWWVEADQNIPSGESLVRQGLYGQSYFQKRFGRRARIAWTPDSFGYPWTLPQIWRGLGMQAFVTQKIRWNDSTEFPHDAFIWEGRDGTRLFSYNPWGYDHNLDGATLAREMRKDNGRTADAHRMMVLYGVGDHGGGPTIEMLERREDLQRLPAFPVLRDATPEPALGAIRAAHPDSGWPVWKDELYLEYHRGTYTTQAWMKRRNRRSEELLGTAELLAALDTAPYPRAILQHAWQQTLFNQFHDLLPGSGIRPIYLDAMATYDSVAAAGAAVRDDAFRRLAAQLDTRGDGAAVVVFNPSPWVRTSYAALPVDSALAALRNERELRTVDAAQRGTRAVVSGDSLRFLAREVPALGFKVFWIRRGAASAGTLAATRARLENDFLVVEVDTLTGQLTRIYDKRIGGGHEALASGARGNTLQLFGDRPSNWDAWDIGYTGEAWTLDSVRAVRAGGDDVERWIEFEKPWNATRVVQRIVLRRDEPLVEIATTMDWAERRKLLKVAFDWNVTADSAFYEIAYGAIGQPTAPRTQAERAKYEHAGHRWADLSDSTFGVSLLNDSKYGWDTRGQRMRLSLLRAPIWPDSLADRGRQEFRYAVYPHAGDWRTGATIRRAMEFNQPLLAAREPAHAGAAGRGGHSWSFASVDADNVYITAVKRAEDSNAYVLRLVEWHGRPAVATVSFGGPLARVRLANLLEDPASSVPLGRSRRSVTLRLKPWEIVTLLVEARR